MCIRDSRGGEGKRLPPASRRQGIREVVAQHGLLLSLIHIWGGGVRKTGRVEGVHNVGTVFAIRKSA